MPISETRSSKILPPSSFLAVLCSHSPGHNSSGQVRPQAPSKNFKLLLIYFRGHLYRYHRIFQCPRCKTLHQTSDELEQHVLAVKGCELNHDQPAEGITGNIEKQLKSRKKTHRAQSESERWQEMYMILFPLEEAPSPCKLHFHFATIQPD